MVPTIKLSSGFDMPVIGLGTWLSPRGEVAKAIRAAFDVGYRHVDCAYLYLNQEEIREVFTEYLQGNKIRREDLFVTSKIWNTHHSYEQAKEQIQTNLDQLGLDYLDLCLIHWPMGYAEGTGQGFPKDESGNIAWSDVDYMETYRALEDSVSEGKVRSIGLSNFNEEQLKRVLDKAKIHPVMNQVECHPYFNQNSMLKFCKDNNVAITCYSPLANAAPSVRELLKIENQPSIFTDPIFKTIGEAHNKTSAQVALRWAIQRGTIVIPKSVTPHRIKENFDVFDFQLTEEEMSKIRYDFSFRVVPDHDDNVKNHPEFPYKD